MDNVLESECLNGGGYLPEEHADGVFRERPFRLQIIRQIPCKIGIRNIPVYNADSFILDRCTELSKLFEAFTHRPTMVQSVSRAFLTSVAKLHDEIDVTRRLFAVPQSDDILVVQLSDFLENLDFFSQQVLRLG